VQVNFQILQSLQFQESKLFQIFFFGGVISCFTVFSSAISIWLGGSAVTVSTFPVSHLAVFFSLAGKFCRVSGARQLDDDANKL